MPQTKWDGAKDTIINNVYTIDSSKFWICSSKYRSTEDNRSEYICVVYVSIWIPDVRMNVFILKRKIQLVVKIHLLTVHDDDNKIFEQRRSDTISLYSCSSFSLTIWCLAPFVICILLHVVFFGSHYFNMLRDVFAILSS